MAKNAKASSKNAMDYSEHDKTYNLFIKASIWGVYICLALLIAMAVGFFTSFGYISIPIIFGVLMVIGYLIIS